MIQLWQSIDIESIYKISMFNGTIINLTEIQFNVNFRIFMSFI